ncbi:acyl-CoA N-acyltransferase [Rhizodiscina lignyota]|uniref:Histone acetyltransferase type B catalytic subunit n=1 Tax=Rhizodiscina lignyota TaxID=1504668 RepID=A0A9P4IJN6_9PEZI|nr:acyl-CoA N-acyltransferase [Rhizodiscina lignyota]
MADELDPSMIEKYLTNSNDAFYINLTRNGKDIFPESFNPSFTYPIFGNDEAIIGYENPQIDLKFRAYDLKPSVKFTYDSKFKAIGETEAMDVEGMLKEFLPESAFEAPAQNGASSTNKSWSPSGELVKEYHRDGKRFQIWCSTLLDEAARDILRNMRILVPLLIEGGTPCHYLDDPDWSLSRWKLFLLYEVRVAKDKVSTDYTLAGFSTSYRLWVFPDRTVRTAMGERVPSPPPESELDFEENPDEDEAPGPRQTTPPPEDAKLNLELDGENTTCTSLGAPSRERISQFIILPPYQGASHGSALYDTMIDMFRADKWVYEITVEDPNEEFDALRDYQDLAYLQTMPEFALLTMKADVPSELLAPDADVPIDYLVDQDLLDKLQHKSKISPRQFARLVEIQLLSSIPPGNRSTNRLIRREKSSMKEDRMFWFWRLYVKHRIYIKNADQLIQLDLEERGPKVAEAVEGQLQEYLERLEVFERRKKRVVRDAPANGGASASRSPEARRKGKGKRVIEDDEDEDEDEDMGMAVEVTGKKKRKIA